VSRNVKEKEQVVAVSVSPNAVPTVVSQNGAPSKIVKAKETMSLVATTIPVVGFVGTLAVWAATNYYVGEVAIEANAPFTSLTVKAFDKKGQESTFHTPRFQLMPGSYHLEIQADNGKPQHVDAQVAFQKVAAVPVEVKANTEEASNQDSSEASENQKKRHWWQLWRRSEN
jgi:hypothetical protein